MNTGRPFYTLAFEQGEVWKWKGQHMNPTRGYTMRAVGLEHTLIPHPTINQEGPAAHRRNPCFISLGSGVAFAPCVDMYPVPSADGGRRPHVHLASATLGARGTYEGTLVGCVSVACHKMGLFQKGGSIPPCSTGPWARKRGVGMKCEGYKAPAEGAQG